MVCASCSRTVRRASAASVAALGVLLSVGVAARQGPPAGTPAGTVWDGVFTSEQAERGRRSYGDHCARCHGAELRGGEYRALTGDRFWASWQEATVGRLLDYISTSMPMSEDGSLKGTLGAPVYADIVSYILHSNGFPAGGRELTASEVAGVRITKKDGSGELPAGSFVQVVGCLARGEKTGQWRVTRASAPARAESAPPAAAADALGTREFALLFVITPLDKMAGHRVTVRGSLVGAGGADGINVTTVESVSATCG